MSAELLPCPFCQSSEVSVHLPTCTKTTPYDASHRAFPKARCRSCGASKDGRDWDQTGKSAIEAWNTRAAPPPLSPPATGNVGAMSPRNAMFELLIHVTAEMKRRRDHDSIVNKAWQDGHAFIMAIPAQPPEVDDWCQYIAGMIETYLTMNPAPEVREAAIAGIVQRRLHWLPAFSKAVGHSLECTRSHPHENMDPMCELRTKIARLENAAAALPPPGRGMVPMTPEKRDEIYRQVQAEVAQMEAEHRYTFAGWFPVAVRLVEEFHGIKEGS